MSVGEKRQVQKVPLSVGGQEEGPLFSEIVYGVWRWNSAELDDQKRSELLNACFSQGMTTFDGADIYGGHTCEQLFGKALHSNPSIRRSDVQIVTKCDIAMGSQRHPEVKFKHYDTSKAYILRSVRQTLEDLQTSHVDLLLIHRPDFLMNPDEVAEAFQVLKGDGLVRHFGVSNFSPSQFDMLSSRLSPSTPLVTNQVELSPITATVLSDGTLDQCITRRIKPMLWSPLKHLHVQSFDKNILANTHRVLEEVSASHGNVGVDKVSLAWGLRHPSNPVTIIGTTKKDRIDAAVESLNIHLTREEWFKIWCAGAGRAEVP